MSAPESPPPRRGFGPRLLLILVLIGAIAAFYLAGLHRTLSWDNVHSQIDAVKSWVDENRLVAILAFFTIYFVATALSLPAAALLSLVGGALFGVWLGAAILSAASTLGATCAMLMSRYLLGDWVQRRWGSRLGAFNRGIETDGAYYLLTLRVVPVFPFFLINLGMGLTKMPIRTYIGVSWVGMLPGSILYAYFGQKLGEISSPKDVLSSGMLIALALLGLVPLVLRWLLKHTAAT